MCATELPAPWREALAEGVVEWEGDPGFVAAVAPDGSLLVRIWVPEVRNELWWHPVDGEPVLVHDLGFAYRNLGVVGADTDGRYVAYGLTRWDHGETWALYVWDSQAGAAPVPLIEFGPEEWGMLHPPIVHDGQVYWAHRAEGGSTTTLYRYRIADGANDVVHTGNLGGPKRGGDLLIWPEWTDQSGESELRALDLATGEQAEGLPAVLTDRVARMQGLAGAAGVLAWVEGNANEQLWLWRADWEAPARILIEEEHTVGYLSVTTDLLAWQQGRVYLLDQRTGGYAPLTEEYGGVALSGPWLLLSYPSPDKTQPDPEVLIDTRTLPPLPGCD